ncbi:MAG TPA: hypothetical protein VK902_16275 [Rubrobacter sp.]|nr:hypothetical protein [Rubrobacter sp.]
MTGHLELWVLGLLAAVAGLVMLSNRLGVPYPVFLVLGTRVGPCSHRARDRASAGSGPSDLPPTAP